jgi:hypothetical protein
MIMKYTYLSCALLVLFGCFSKRGGEQMSDLVKLREANFLKGWSPSLSEEEVSKIRAIIEKGIDELIQISDRGSKDEKLSILKTIVININEADEGFICTIEREDLCEFLFEVGEAVGVDGDSVEDVLSERDW